MKMKYVCALLGGLLLAPLVHAQQVLFLSPNETDGSAQGLTARAYNAFRAAAGAPNMVDARGALSSATPDPHLFDGSKIVVLTTTYAKINPAWEPVLRDAMLNRPDLTFVLFPDGCCGGLDTTPPPGNATIFLNIINDGTGWGITASNPTSAVSSPLNTNSLYAGSFTAVNPLNGQDYGLLANVPADNALYLAAGATPPAPGAAPTNAYGFFVPQQRFNAGKGACTFLTADISPFSVTQTAQHVPLAQAFMHAATDPNGACKQATREPDLAIEVAGPTNPLAGQPSEYTFTVTNKGASAADASTARITVPSGMTIDASTLPTACTAAGQAISCAVNPLDPGAHQEFKIRLIPIQLGVKNLDAQVDPATGEANTSNNHRPLLLTIGAPAAVRPVPALNIFGLLGLSALVPMLMRRYRRRG